jgi:hypothetical protein
MKRFGWIILGGALLLLGGVLDRNFTQRTRAAGTWVGRHFYITKTRVQGDQALSACSAGYHMASMWEIYDLAGLQYETTLGLTVADSGSGPPSSGQAGVDAMGWIRTGNVPTAGITEAGSATCNVWTSNSPTQNGALIILNPAWHAGPSATASIPASPWVVINNPPGATNNIADRCNIPHRVWCVEN